MSRVDEVLEEWLAGRQWIRCSECQEAADATDDEAPDFVISVDEERVHKATCYPCAGLARDGTPLA